MRRTFGQAVLVGLVIAVLFVEARNSRAQYPPSPTEPVIHPFPIPPAPVLSPADELKTIRIAAGFRLELVASEPLVQDPVSISFDPDGRVYVCEMQSFMHDVRGTGQQEPTCTISVLQDTNGDGVMDSRTVFLDKLVLPRSVCWTADGVLVTENGHIWLCKDVDGDLKSDSKELIAEYTPGNVEHSLNGLMPALDNWIYNAKEGVRLRKVDGRWIKDSTLARGQWGIAQDDYGYLYYNVNTQLIRGDLVPCYSPNANVLNARVNVPLYSEQAVWSIRPNSGVNRGYIENFLRPDGSMIDPNSNCGPVIFRGDNLPAELRGDCFINEPAGNLIRRQVFVTENGWKTSKNAYDKTEFIAATDERFRPVNMFNAPDGTIYMVDMYRGIIQDGAYMTPYLRNEVAARKLDEHIGLGRIWRIAHETTQKRPPIALSRATPAELVAHLSSLNGWHRDMAQQMLVGRGDVSAVPALQRLATSGQNPLGRLHALWVLDGLRRLDSDTLTSALDDADVNVRASAIYLCQYHILRDAQSPLVDRLISLSRREADPTARMQIAFALGQVNSAAADQVLEPMLKEAAADRVLLESLLAGFAGKEVELLASHISLPAWKNPESWREQLLTASAGLLWRQRQPFAVLRIMHLIGQVPGDRTWQQIALLDGMAQPAPRGGRGTGSRPLVLPTAPETIDKLRSSPDPRLAAAAQTVASQLNWPGKDGQALPVPPPLSPQHQTLYDLGRAQYLNTCAACHHPAGFGDAGKGPPLLDSDWLKNDDRLIRVALHGLRGPITINEEPFNANGVLEMPGHYQALDDEKIAGILTYIRREWGENAPPIESAAVARIRAATPERTHQWNQKELSEIK